VCLYLEFLGLEYFNKMEKKKAHNRKYLPEYCQTIKEIAKEGWSFSLSSAKLGVTATTMRRWIKEHPEFAKAVREAYP